VWELGGVGVRAHAAAFCVCVTGIMSVSQI